MPSVCETNDLEDIEDITSEERLDPVKVVPKVLSRKTAWKSTLKIPERDESVENSPRNHDAVESHVPGTQTIYVKTWGCSHNSSDSEYMAGQLAAYGYKVGRCCHVQCYFISCKCKQ